MLCSLRSTDNRSCLSPLAIMSKLSKLSKKAAQRSTAEGMVLVSELPPERRIHGVGDLPDQLPGARVVSQSGVFSQVINAEVSNNSMMDYPLYKLTNEDGDDVDMIDETDARQPAKDIAAEERTSKKQRQWRRWSEEIIPEMLRPYIALL